MPRCFKKTILLTVIALLTLSTTTTAVDVRIPCCVLWDALGQYVSSETGSTWKCADAAQCIEKSQIRILVQEMQAFANLSTSGTEVVMVVQDGDSGELAQLLAMSLVARFVPKKQDASDKHPFLEYNDATSKRRIRTPMCEFQKNLYVSIIVISISILIFVMVTQNVEEVPEGDSKEPLLEPQNDSKPRAARHIQYESGQEAVVPVWSGMRFRM